MLYKDTAEEIRHSKRQQWVIANYALLLIGAIIYLYHLLDFFCYPKAKWVLMIFALIIAGVETLLQIEIQCHFKYLRRREKRIRIHFSRAFQEALLSGKPEPERYTSFWHWGHYLILFAGIVWVGVIFVWWFLFPDCFYGCLKWVINLFPFWR